MPDSRGDSLDGVSERGWAVAVPTLFAWVKVMPTGRGFYPTEQAAKDALAQFGPRNAQVIKGGTRY